MRFFLIMGPNQLPDTLVVVLSTKGFAKPTNTHPIFGLSKNAIHSRIVVKIIEKVIERLIPYISMTQALGRYKIATENL